VPDVLHAVTASRGNRLRCCEPCACVRPYHPEVEDQHGQQCLPLAAVEVHHRTSHRILRPDQRAPAAEERADSPWLRVAEVEVEEWVVPPCLRAAEGEAEVDQTWL
jgi:hypothetical protein